MYFVGLAAKGLRPALARMDDLAFHALLNSSAEWRAVTAEHSKNIQDPT